MGAQTNRQRSDLVLTEEFKREICRLFFAKRMKQRQIAALFGVSRPLISRVVCESPAGVRWDLVPAMDPAKYPHQPEPEKPAVRGAASRCPICNKWRVHHVGGPCSDALQKLYGKANESIA